MQARFIRKLSENTSLFACDPPMMFLSDCNGAVPCSPSPINFSGLVVAWSGEMAPGYNRAVLHAAHLLAGDEGIAYGATGSRILDGIENHEKALTASGYSVDFSAFDKQAGEAPTIKQ